MVKLASASFRGACIGTAVTRGWLSKSGYLSKTTSGDSYPAFTAVGCSQCWHLWSWQCGHGDSRHPGKRLFATCQNSARGCLYSLLGRLVQSNRTTRIVADDSGSVGPGSKAGPLGDTSARRGLGPGNLHFENKGNHEYGRSQ